MKKPRQWWSLGIIGCCKGWAGTYVQGAGYINDEQKNEKIEQSASIIAQHFVQAYKSDKQISQQSEKFRTKPVYLTCLFNLFI